ncbi:MAG: DEAD/DEAH box helicase, partial [Rhodospirillales bacterium]
EPQIRGLNRGVDVVVSTPGRLLDHLETGAVTLDDCQVVVLDEADQMLDMGFLPAMRQILSKTPAGRQTILLSATMPDAIRQLARDVLNDPAEISVAPAATPIERISQQILHVDMGAKSGLIADLLADRAVERAIVFTRTKRGADRVSLTLQKAGLTAAAIHGDKSQSQRDKALKLFKTGTVRILVATDVAARGIDVPDVSHVVNYDLPNVPEAYVHRIGRTARAGREGVALSFCDETELDYLRDIEKLIGSSIWSESLRKDKRTPKVGVKPPPRGKRPQGQNSQGPNAQSKKPQGQKFQGQKPQGQKPQGQKSSGAKYRGRTRAA